MDKVNINNAEALKEYLSEMTTETVVLDVETENLSKDCELLGIQLYDGKLIPCFIFVDSPIFKGVPIDEILAIFLEFNYTSWGLIGQNIKYDLTVLKYRNFPDATVKGDTMVAMHILNPDQKKNLEFRVKEDLKITKKSFAELVGKKWDKIDWLADTKPSTDKKSGNRVPPLITKDLLATYGCEDVYYTYKLYLMYSKQLKERELEDVYYKMELPIIYPLVYMKYDGVNIDVPKLNKIDKEIVDRVNELETEIYEEAGEVFNINSGPQKATILFDKLGLPIKKKSAKTGKPSSDKAVLEKLASEGHKIAELIQERSGLEKLHTGYSSTIPLLLDNDGRLRGDLNSCGTATGRFCVSEDTMIETSNGLIRIGDIVPNEEGSIVLDESIKVLTHKGNYKPITHSIHKGYEEMYEVTLDNGMTIECTLNHRFLSSDGVTWITLKDIITANETSITFYLKSRGMFKTSKIVSIKPIGRKKVCDITVKDDSSYVGNGIVNHNSSSNPNLQNQPNRDDFPIREAFIPNEGEDLVVLDWSQIELRVIAHCTGDKNYMDAFFNDVDVHQLTADVLGIARKHAKVVNFGIPYGMGDSALAGSLKVSTSEAKNILNEHKKKYLNYWRWDSKVKNIALRSGKTTTVFGRERLLSSRDSYKAPNTIIQGSSADLMKLCMIQMFKKIVQEPYYKGTKMLITVHDEIMFSCPKHLSLELYDHVEKIMNTTVSLRVPLKADGKIVSNWHQMKSDQEKGLSSIRLAEKSSIVTSVPLGIQSLFI